MVPIPPKMVCKRVRNHYYYYFFGNADGKYDVLKYVHLPKKQSFYCNTNAFRIRTEAIPHVHYKTL